MVIGGWVVWWGGLLGGVGGAGAVGGAWCVGGFLVVLGGAWWSSVVLGPGNP